MSKQHTGHRVVAALLMAQQLGACTTWRVQRGTPEQLIVEQQPRRVLVTTLDGGSVELREPIELIGDRLIGVIARGENRGALVDVPVDSVKTVAVRRGDPVETLVSVGIVGAIVVGVFLAVASNMFETPQRRR